MNGKDLKKDSYVKWEARRMLKGWNTFGKVTNLTKKEVTILTFDDFKETTISRTGEAVDDEIYLVTKQDVEDNLLLSRIELDAQIGKVELEALKEVRELQKIKRKITEYIDGEDN